MIKTGQSYLDIPISNDDFNKRKNIELLLS